jgi:heptosyltransferase-2
MKQKILLIQTAFLGDLIITTSLIREIKIQYPDCDLDILVNQGTERVLDGLPYLTKVIPFNKKESNFISFWKLIQSLRKNHYDICIAAHFSFRSSLISYLSRAKIRIGYKESGFSFLHTKLVSRPLRGFHEIQKLKSLLNPESIDLKDCILPELIPTEKSKSEFLKFKSEYNLKNYIIISPSSVWETKKLPHTKFIELSKLILTKFPNYQIVLTGSSKDSALCESILESLVNEFNVRIKNLAGLTDLNELIPIIQNSKLVITNDSSPTHYASATNTPVIVIYGATIPDFGYGPLSNKSWISQVDGLKCRPCGIHGGNICPEVHFKCMNDQDLNSIIKKMEEWFK